MLILYVHGQQQKLCLVLSALHSVHGSRALVIAQLRRLEGECVLDPLVWPLAVRWDSARTRYRVVAPPTPHRGAASCWRHARVSLFITGVIPELFFVVEITPNAATMQQQYIQYIPTQIDDAYKTNQSLALTIAASPALQAPSSALQQQRHHGSVSSDPSISRGHFESPPLSLFSIACPRRQQQL